MRLLVHTDQAYRRDAQGSLWSGRSFTVFLDELSRHVDHLAIAGRLEPERESWHHPLDGRVAFHALPSHRGPARPWRLMRASAAALWRFWRALDDADVVWLLGPNLLTAPFAGLALLRGRPVVLGVRQDLLEYLRNRHPGRRAPLVAGRLLEAAFGRLARRRPVVAVGAAMAARYAHAPAVLDLCVSLVSRRDIAPPGRARGSAPHRRLLSVTRLDAEKNPLLLADVLDRLGPEWRLEVCGDGPLRGALEARLSHLGLADRAELCGYVGGDLLQARYRQADAFLHVSFAEGLPQVLFEAFAAGLPTVATDVGGVAAAADGAAVLIAPGDAEAAAAAVTGLFADPVHRDKLIHAGTRHVRAHTVEAESLRVARFLKDAAQPGGASSMR